MNRFVARILVAFAAFGFAFGAAAQEKGNKDEALAMVNAAVEHVKKVGVEKAMKDFTEDKTTWWKKDLYVMAYDHNGVCIGHGANAKLVGKNLIEFKDPDGKQIVKEMVDLSKSKGSGWIDYSWPNPTTKKPEPKTTFVQRLPGQDAWIGVGIYK